MPLSAATPSFARRVWRAALVLVLGAWALLLVGWLALHALVLGQLDGWRPRIEAALNQRLAPEGLTLRIGSLHAQSSRWVPTLTADDLTLEDAAGQVLLHVPRVTALASARTLLRAEPVFEQIVVETPRVTVQRDAANRWRVAGMLIQPGASEDGSAAADWVLSQPEILVRAGQVRWEDEASGLPAVELTGVDVLLRHALHRHQWQLAATPPPAWGERYTLRGDFRRSLLTRPGNVAQWNGQLYADAPLLDWRPIKPYLHLPVDVGTGRGALRGWLTREDGHWQAATLDVALQGVQGRAAGDLPPLQWQALQGRMQVQRLGQRYTARTQGMQGQMQDGTPWPAGDVTLHWRQRDGSAPADVAAITGGELQVPTLALHGATELALRLPLPPRVRQTLADMAPQGQLSGFTLRWEGPPDTPSAWQAALAADDVALRAERAGEPKALGRPGVRGLSAQVQASEAGGTASVRIAQGALTFPGVFAQPDIALTRADASLRWTMQADPAGGTPQVAVQVSDARFANPDVSGQLSGRWETGAAPGVGAGKRLPGRIDLSGTLSQGRGTQVVRYLPLEIPAQTRDYIAAAVRSGQIDAARFEVKGDLWDFPYASGEPGVFRIAGRVHGLELAYVPPGLIKAGDPGWPPFTEVSGELLFDRAHMQIKDASARLWGVALSGVQGEIPDLAADAPELHVRGSGHGPLKDALRFLEATPIAGWMGHALADAQASGDAGLDLSLTIPLLDAGHTRLQGRIALAGNDVRLRPDTPLLAGARGEIHFTENDFQVQDAEATVLGGAARFGGGSTKDGALRFTGEGRVTAAGLRDAAAWGSGWAEAARWARAAQGEARYTLALTLRDGHPELAIASTLQGLAVNLPAPLHKPAEAAWPLDIRTTLAAGGRSDVLAIRLDGIAQARYERDLSDAAARVRRGGIAVGDAALPTPARGVVAALALPALDADAWRAALRGLGETAAPADPAAEGYLPGQIDARIERLTAAGLPWPQQRLQARPGAAAGHWLLSLQGPNAQGEIDAGPRRIQARLARLVVGEGQAGAAEAPPHEGDWPELDVVVEALGWRGQTWGRLTLAAHNQAGVWDVPRLELAGPSATLNASGRWTPGARTELKGELAVADAGQLIEHLGLGPLVRGGRGRIRGELGWPGGPGAFSLAGLQGQIDLDIQRGQFLQVEPGAARLLGILSLQTLPRRLLLDFRDVFAKGFVFDQIEGDVTLQAAQARTQNLRIRGVQAAILVEGQADLARETQDLHVVIVPEINAGTASLAYAAINPVLGLGSFLAQFLLRRPLQEANTRELHITGTWDDPQVETLKKAPSP